MPKMYDLSQDAQELSQFVKTRDGSHFENLPCRIEVKGIRSSRHRMHQVLTGEHGQQQISIPKRKFQRRLHSCCILQNGHWYILSPLFKHFKSLPPTNPHSLSSQLHPQLSVLSMPHVNSSSIPSAYSSQKATPQNSSLNANNTLLKPPTFSQSLLPLLRPILNPQRQRIPRLPLLPLHHRHRALRHSRRRHQLFSRPLSRRRR